jgi:putative membrane protein
MNSPFARLLVRWLVLALGVVIATRVVPGIHCNDLGTLVAVVVLLSVFNAVLRPLLVLFTLPFIIVTMGLGIVVINAILFLFVGRLVDGFTVTGFWPALGGSLVVSVTSFIVSGFTRSARARRPPPGGVIDI